MQHVVGHAGAQDEAAHEGAHFFEPFSAEK